MLYLCGLPLYTPVTCSYKVCTRHVYTRAIVTHNTSPLFMRVDVEFRVHSARVYTGCCLHNTSPLFMRVAVEFRVYPSGTIAYNTKSLVMRVDVVYTRRVLLNTIRSFCSYSTHNVD